MDAQDKGMVQTYRRVATNKSILALTNPFIPRPSESDYAFGEIRRFFSQQTNRSLGEIVEISKGTFDALQEKSLFTVVELRWKISGPAEDTTDTVTGEIEVRGVRSANSAAVRSAVKTIPAINKKLTNVFQLWQGF